jgi:membrane fusion protein, heavy metal efflux system
MGGGRTAATVLLGFMLACPSEQKQKAAAPAPPTPEHADEPKHAPLPTRVVLSEAVVRDAKLRTARVGRERLAPTLALPGEVVADPDRSARLASPIAGRIASVHFQEGSTVQKGAVLAVIAVPDLGRLRSEHAALVARAKAARVNAARLSELYEQRLASEQLQLDAIATAEALEVEARAAGERLTALGLTANGPRPHAAALTLRAPLSGTVISRAAVVGQPVNADQVLCELVDLTELWFLGRVFEKDLARLALGAAAEVQLNAYPEVRFPGSVEYIGRQVDPVARTVTARIRIVNRDDLLRVGLFGTAHVSSEGAGDAQPVLVVPRSALTDVADRDVVFVRHADKDFELHEVSLGRSAAGKVEILAGLREGEQVVVDGVFTLKSAILKSTFAEEE